MCYISNERLFLSLLGNVNTDAMRCITKKILIKVLFS